MRHGIGKHALGALALLAVGCSGHDILLSTGNAAGAGGGDDVGGSANAGASSVGGGYQAGIGGDSGDPSLEVGEAGRKGWVAYDADLSAFGVPGGRHIQIATVDGACRRPLTDGPDQEKQPTFSADGRQVAFASDSTGIFQIYVMDLASGRRTQMSNVPEGASYPAWASNGRSIAFVTGDPEDQANGTSTVELVDTATLHMNPLTTAQQPPYTWSAFAGNDLLLVGNEMNLIGIHTDTLATYDVVPFNGRIPNPASPSISPDGSRYVFSDYCGGQKQLYVARVDGKTGDTCANALRLAAYSDALISASWGPAGYVAAETKQHDIVLVPSDGTPGVQVLVNTAAAERNPAFASDSVRLNCTK